MRRSTPAVILTWFTCVLCAVSPAQAQDADGLAAGRGPQFLMAAPQPSDTPVPVDAASVAVLRRRVSLDLQDVGRAEALAAISQASGLRLVYASGVVPREGRVRLKAQAITVAAALTEVLLDAGVDVVLSSGGNAVLVKRTAPAAPAVGSVSGRITDAKTGNGLAAAEVFLEGTSRRATTREDGSYRLAEVAVGSYTLAVRRVGYAKQTRPVTVVGDQELTVDVALEPVATQLDEIVTTVTGEQRLRELGHVVGRINADSLVKEAPVSNVTELLAARVPGLLVQTERGTVGGEVSLRVRTATSTMLSTEPIVIVDGVRYSSGNGVMVQGASIGPGSPFGNELTNRLNDLNPNDIESVEVVKGPSAATLYGTDAANGVIVITTKRGRAGPARWNAYARATTNEIPNTRLPDGYWGWGSATTSCALKDVAAGLCVQDSVTVLPNPLNDPALSIFGDKPRWEYGANVGGGSQTLRYYFSADFEDAVGAIRMPPEVVEAIEARRGVSELPEEQLEPNAFTKLNLRSTASADFGERGHLEVTAGYTQSATRTLASRGASYLGPVLGTPESPFFVEWTPEDLFSQMSTERLNRFFGSATGEWRPWAWLLTRATVGIDLANSNTYSLARPGDTPGSFYADGLVGDTRIRHLVSTADLGATASFRFGRLSSRTSVGAQYIRDLYDQLSSTGWGLPPGGSSIGEAATVQVGQAYNETATLGSYLEQTLGLNDRLFLTGALRVDGASGFGQDYDAAFYPKAGVSWIVSEEPFIPRVPGLDELRLRYGFGASGRQPWSFWTRPGYFPYPVFVDGTAGKGVDRDYIGNPDLRPERVREHEFGVDAIALGGRLGLELTWNRRTTVDQLQSLFLGPGLNDVWTNVGLIRGHGFEARVTGRVLDHRAVSLDLAVTHAWHDGELVELGAAERRLIPAGGWAEGYPIGARFIRPLLGYSDANGDGIIAPSEVQMGDSMVYVGRSIPPRTQTLSVSLGLLGRRVRLSTLLDRQSGFTQISGWKAAQCDFDRCRAAVDPSVPLAEQAEVAALEAVGSFSYTMIEPGDFTRLREVTLSFDVPMLARAARLRQATLSLQGRNLALWKSFSGADPESALGEDIPQARSWVLRLDLGF